MEKLISVIGFIKSTIRNKSFQVKHKTNCCDFKKECLLDFEKVMLIVLGRTNTLLDFEIMNFCEKTGMGGFSKSAMVEARKKICFKAFRCVLQNLSHLLPKSQLHKGYQLVGVDGTELQLPKSPAIKKIYGTKRDNCNWPRAHI